MLPLLLAPMAGFTDAPFRRICHENGATESVSEMISAAALHYRDKKTAQLATLAPGEGDTWLQIFGHDPAMMAEGAEILIESQKNAPDGARLCGIDINMGCPVHKIVGNGDGSALMLTPDLAAEVTRAAAEVCHRHKLPLSVKIRAGFDRDHINAPDFACRMADAGADRIALHCRTRAELYTPGIHPEVLEATALALSAHYPAVSLIGNGDVTTVSDALAMLHCGAAGVMIGRGALGNPWIFRQIEDAHAGRTPYQPDRREICETAIRLVHEIVELRGERSGIRESRGRAAHFIVGMPGSAAVRARLNQCETEAEFVAILAGLL